MRIADQQRAGGPRVGIFWSIPEVGNGQTLVADMTSLAEAEPYGDFLTHPHGHYEVWEIWRHLGPEGLRKRGLPAEIAWHEYEHFPRGRIVFHVPTSTFFVYADSILHNVKTVAEIEALFNLEGTRSIVKSDEHYRTS